MKPKLPKTKDHRLEKAINFLERIVDDSFADLNYPNKRVWAIRASLNRKIQEFIKYKYNSKRAMKDQIDKTKIIKNVNKLPLFPTKEMLKMLKNFK